MFIQHGFALWSNYWYAGHYSYITYSVLYYPLAAVIGIKLLAVATAALAAAAFASLIHKEWPTAGPWPARAFAFVAAASVLSGAFPYALGFAIGLLALRAARGHPRLFAVLLALTFAASPLAWSDDATPSPSTAELGTVEVTATPLPEHLGTVPQSVDVITRDQLDDLHATDLRSALIRLVTWGVTGKKPTA